MPHGKVICANCVGQLSACSSLDFLAKLHGHSSGQEKPLFVYNLCCFSLKIRLYHFWPQSKCTKNHQTTLFLQRPGLHGCRAVQWLWFLCLQCYYGPFSHCRWEVPAARMSGNGLPLIFPMPLMLRQQSLICFSEVQLIGSWSPLSVADLLHHPAPQVLLIKLRHCMIVKSEASMWVTLIFWVGFSLVKGKSVWR